jgi:hypothetical protein
MKPVVINKYKESGGIYIGRGSYWGNPYPINNEIGDTREVVIARYKDHLRELYKQDKVRFMSELEKLSGNKLSCFCKPKACHGDIIVEVWEVLIGGK